MEGGALSLAILSDKTKTRNFIGFDTFEGHSEPNEDELDMRGDNMRERWMEINGRGGKWAEASYLECLDFLKSLGGIPS